jgi:hypothetical protein
VNGTIPPGEHAVVTQEGPREAAAPRDFDPAYVSSGSRLRFTSLQDRNLNAGEIGWPFRLGLQGCIVDRSQDIGW